MTKLETVHYHSEQIESEKLVRLQITDEMQGIEANYHHMGITFSVFQFSIFVHCYY